MHTENMETSTTSQVRAGARPKIQLTLDDLAGRSFAELGALYAAGALPASMNAVDGALPGRMLAVRHLGLLGPVLRRLAASPRFMWEGKTFTASGDRAGVGINRVRMPGILGKQDLFPFNTSFAPSRIDQRDALVLDYDLPENPPYIRRVHDEIREVAPGIYLGPAMWKAGESATTVLWFALDTGER